MQGTVEQSKSASMLQPAQTFASCLCILFLIDKIDIVIFLDIQRDCGEKRDAEFIFT